MTAADHGRYTLLDADGRRYPSATPGTLGGHRRARLYGRLDDTTSTTGSADVPHDPATLPIELDAVVNLVRGLGDGVVNVGHGRDPASTRRAQAFLDAWTAQDGLLGTVVSWPAHAASWLRQAERLATGADIWVVADTPAGWAGIGPRLAETTRWRADRTVAFPGLDDPRLVISTGRVAVTGLRGVTADGRTWTHDGRWLRITGSGVQESARPSN